MTTPSPDNDRRDAARSLLADPGWTLLLLPHLDRTIRDKTASLTKNRLELEESAAARAVLAFAEGMRAMVTSVANLPADTEPAVAEGLEK